MRLPRETCPRCGREVAIRKNGELREHRPVVRVDGRLCEASGWTRAGWLQACEAGSLKGARS